MTSQQMLKQLMQGLIYPAVLGSVIYTSVQVIVTPLVAGLNPLEGTSALTAIKAWLWLIAVVFYCCDYMYLLFTNDYTLGFFICDTIFTIGLYVTVAAIKTGAPEPARPDLVIILTCYVLFLVLYAGWDFFEFRRCRDTAERSLFKRILLWESTSFATLVLTWLSFIFVHNVVAREVLVTAVLVPITAAFAALTWRKGRFALLTAGVEKAEVGPPAEDVRATAG